MIRKALEDLAYWGSGTQFTLAERKEEDYPVLIREWKEIMTAVCNIDYGIPLKWRLNIIYAIDYVMRYFLCLLLSSNVANMGTV